jgi:NAD-dependent SIR2 family protein deacetylase
MERKIDDLVWTLREAVDHGKKCTLLTGAGCSVNEGIPTAARFVDMIKERNPPAFERATHKTYPHCMAELPPSARRDLIAEFVD